jgi:hypothetical protein
MERETPKVRMRLEGLNGNALVLMAAFANNAKRQGWPKAEIDSVLAEARTGDYAHLLATLIDHVEEPDDEV